MGAVEDVAAEESGPVKPGVSEAAASGRRVIFGRPAGQIAIVHRTLGGIVAGAFFYEHAYHMDYGAAAKYVDAFLQNVNREEVSRRVEAVTKR